MSDRDVFQENLNYYLRAFGKSQIDLALFTGVTKSTVSGWVHGISYPRADSMEKISMFFGIRLSDLVMPRNSGDPDESRLLAAWRSADPEYQRFALEILESHPRKKESSASAI